MSDGFVRLRNTIQDYAWGSRTAIATFLGRANAEGRPEAELWIGAHPKGPSVVLGHEDEPRLSDWIAADPAARLGDEVATRFQGQLPFLLKVLAVAEPLSIQAHPNRDQAREGFARENAAFVPLDAPTRSYRDANHKPELVAALTRFTTLSGFRPVEEIVAALSEVGAGILGPELGRLRSEGTPDSLRSLFARLMRIEAPRRRELVAAAARRATDSGPESLAHEWVRKLSERYPDDIGALSPLFLNLAVLEPEEALFLDAGELHAYLEGFALEIMANSDNVLRGGLTVKHVDVSELIRTLSFRPGRPAVIRPEVASATERVYRAPAGEFELGLIRVLPSRVHAAPTARGPEVLLCIEGESVVSADGREALLRRGEALFVPASSPAYSIAGTARLCRAGVPRCPALPSHLPE
jgi:mannose-6-phosphate isomerase